MKKRILPELFPSTVFLIILLAACTKYSPLIPTEDPERHKRDSIIKTLNQTLSPDSIEKTITWLQEMETRFALAANRKDVAVKIKNRFIKLGYPDTRIDSFWISVTWNNLNYTLWQYNVIAEVRGLIYPDSVAIAGAHYDSKVLSGDPFTYAPGASDNASGTAVIMEIARVMRVKNYTSPITVQFVAFGAEEVGLLGSYDYALKLAQAGKSVRFMINNDLVSYTTSPDSKKINIIDYENSKDLSARAKILCSLYTDLFPVNNNALSGRSDSYPFYLNDYKAIFLISNNLPSYYHTPNDLAQNCNFDFCTQVACLTNALLVY